MPELPEVEVTARGLALALEGKALAGWRHSGRPLRYPMPRRALNELVGAPVVQLGRRAKFLLIEFDRGWLAIHLGMSGSCRLCEGKTELLQHDHLMLRFEGGQSMVLHDPRRFGSVRWLERCGNETQQSIGQRLGSSASGLEPFDPQMTGRYLHQQARGRQIGVKQWLMEGKAVVGVGNIYACEALFRAGIHPARAANRVALARYHQLALAVAQVMRAAIEAGGSTLRDFSAADGSQGRYGQAHQVYGREGLACYCCKTPIRRMVQQQRSTFYCHVCQK